MMKGCHILKFILKKLFQFLDSNKKIWFVNTLILMFVTSISEFFTISLITPLLLILSNPKSKKPLVYWDAKKFLNWVYKYKVNTDPQFDYEYHSKAVAVALIKGVKKNGN